jgi:uncharacterized membrane protein YedE/YeeE
VEVIDWTTAGGFLCGALAGGAARYGRLCTMSAIEDALVGHDYRGARAWLLAVVVATLLTMGFGALGLADIASSHYAIPRQHLAGILLGGVLFGLGMTFVGTCSFGLIVRSGGGDMRAAVTAMVVGIFAFAVTAGAFSVPRQWFLRVGMVDLGGYGGATFDRLGASVLGSIGTNLVIVIGLLGVAAFALADPRLRRRRRLIAGTVALGAAISLGWLATTKAVVEFEVTRVESLSFVAPVGRLLLQVMAMPFRGVGFGVASVLGVVLASFVVAALRRELRWEAFDDPTEMRRHLVGGALMGVGGVLAQGCTIGQGMSGMSALAVSAPLFMVAMLTGAHAGLKYLIEGTALWRLGFSSRSEQ